MLAATLSPSYGIYSGFEHFENVPVREGSEEYLDSEKYEVKKRTLDGPLLPLVKRLNAIRRENRALQRLDERRLPRDRERAADRVRRSAPRGTSLIVVRQPRSAVAPQEGVVDRPGLARAAAGVRGATELLTDEEFHWRIGRNYVRLGPGQSHVLRVETR